MQTIQICLILSPTTGRLLCIASLYLYKGSHLGPCIRPLSYVKVQRKEFHMKKGEAAFIMGQTTGPYRIGVKCNSSLGKTFITLLLDPFIWRCQEPGTFSIQSTCFTADWLPHTLWTSGMLVRQETIRKQGKQAARILWGQINRPKHK